MKRIICTFLSVMMLISILSVGIVSANAKTFGDYEYSIIDDGKAKITKYNGSDSSVIIPSKIDSCAVIEIGSNAFADCKSLTNVSLPESLETLGADAFEGCSGLTKIHIPANVKKIGHNAYEDGFFSRDFNPFTFCDNLKSIVVDNKNKVYDSRDNCNAIIETKTNTLICGNKYTKIPKSIKTIAIYAFLGCQNISTVTIPDNITIDEYAFSSCNNLKTIKLHTTVRIEKYAFVNTGITDVYYQGSKGEWDSWVTISSWPNDQNVTYGNDSIIYAKKHYNSTIDSKKNNTLTVKASTKTLKASAMKKAKKTVKPLKISKAKGTVKIVKVKKGTTGSIYNKITVNKKSGAITFKKGKYAKKTYKIKIKVTAAGNSGYKSTSKTVTVKVKVK